MARKQNTPSAGEHQESAGTGRTKKNRPQDRRDHRLSVFALLESLGVNLDALEAEAKAYFARIRWPDGIRCPNPECGSDDVRDVPTGKPMPLRCGRCRQYFSIKLGTTLHRSKIPFRKLYFALYFLAAHYPSVTTAQLADYVDLDEKTMQHLRALLQESMANGSPNLLAGPVEADEMYVGGSESNRHADKRLSLLGRAGKTAICGVKDRPTKQLRLMVTDHVTSEAVRPFLQANVVRDAILNTDGHGAYRGCSDFEHKPVNKSAGESGLPTNGIESEWKEAHLFLDVFRSVRRENLPLYVAELAWKRSVQGKSVQARMDDLASRLMAKPSMTVGEKPGHRDELSNQHRMQPISSAVPNRKDDQTGRLTPLQLPLLGNDPSNGRQSEPENPADVDRAKVQVTRTASAQTRRRRRSPRKTKQPSNLQRPLL